MARLAVTFSVIFSLFLLTHARFPLDHPDGSVTKSFPLTIVLPTVKTESDAIPSEKPSSEFTATPFPESDAVPSEEKPESEAVSVVSLQRPGLTSFDVSFRPVNRHFPRPGWKQPFPRPLPRFRHRCHHHHHHASVQIPYGNDMIQAEEGVEARQIPAGVGGSRGEVEWFVTEEFRGPKHVLGHVHPVEEKEAREDGGFSKWFQEIVNRF